MNKWIWLNIWTNEFDWALNKWNWLNFVIELWTNTYSNMTSYMNCVVCSMLKYSINVCNTNSDLFGVYHCVFTHFTNILPIHGKIANKQRTTIHYFLTTKFRTKKSNIINWLLLFVCFIENTQILLKYQLGCSFIVTFVLRKSCAVWNNDTVHHRLLNSVVEFINICTFESLHIAI